MSKENKEKQGKSRIPAPVKAVTAHLNKKGKLRGKNKKETKMLYSICQHHIVSQNGKVKARISNNDGMCTCKICGEQFPAAPFSNTEVKDAIGSVKQIVNQAKFLATALNAGEDTTKAFSEDAVMLQTLSKRYKRITKIAKKQGDMKKKKKGNGNNNGSQQLGSWG